MRVCMKERFSLKIGELHVKEEKEIQCPECTSEALYKFGRTKWGKQRFQCLICKRQFTLGIQRAEIKDRPSCPKCGSMMHSYMRKGGVSRFRCSNYPECKTYLKFSTEEKSK